MLRQVLEVAHVQIDLRVVGPEHVPQDGPRNDVARGQLRVGVVVLHEGAAAAIAQLGAGAADRLADQRAARAGQVERRGMELHELHVHELRARAPGHRDAIARRDGRIRRLAVDLTEPAGRQDRAPRPDPLQALRGVGHHGAPAGAAGGHQVERVAVLDDARADVPEQFALQHRARLVAPVEHAANRVAPFQPEGEAPAAVAVKGRAPFDELPHPLGSFPDDDLDHCGVREAAADLERVEDVGFRRVLLCDRRRDAPLGVERVRLGALLLGDDEDVLPVPRRGQRRAQGRRAAPDDQDVRVHGREFPQVERDQRAGNQDVTTFIRLRPRRRRTESRSGGR